MNRVQALKEFLADDPGDPFNYYALALEYMKTDRRQALDLFETLVEKFPAYLPTYYPFAHLMIDMGDNARAEKLFNEGVARAQVANDLKTLRELQAAYTDFRFEFGL